MKKILLLIIITILMSCSTVTAFAAAFTKLERPPLSERWFGIYVDNERVGFYRQIISEQPDGYIMDGSGSIRMKVMGFAKEAAMHEIYHVSKNLTMRSCDIMQTINGTMSHITGKVGDNVLRLKNETGGKSTDKVLKFKGEIFPGPALNLYPLLREVAAGKAYKILTFDPEELKIKEVKITVLGEDKSPDGSNALKMRNNLYPFVNNDIWVDAKGNTLFESVREGLVTTKAEDPKQLGDYIGSTALAKKDLIYDFSLVRAEPPVKESKKLKGLAAEISGWNDAIPLLQEGGQTAAKSGDGKIIIKTGALAQPVVDAKPAVADERYLKPAVKIESDAPELVAKSKEVTSGAKTRRDAAMALAAWTADWLRDTIDDGGAAVESFKSRTGNCQTHARLYTALARAAGIPTRFVSGLVSLDGKGFLYHSWTESLIDGTWIAVDPTYSQLPADPTHLKLFEGHTQEDMAPIIAIIGRIKLRIVDAAY